MAAKLCNDRRCKRLWLIYNNQKISFILQRQGKGKTEVTNWLAALNSILIDLAENQSYCLYIYRDMK